MMKYENCTHTARFTCLDDRDYFFCLPIYFWSTDFFSLSLFVSCLGGKTGCYLLTSQVNFSFSSKKSWMAWLKREQKKLRKTTLV